MVYGNPGHDRWQLNDDTCWTGWPGSTTGVPAGDEPSPAVVERVRAALLAGDVVTAEHEIRKVQFGHSKAYQPLAELEIVLDLPGAELDQRRLDLATAVAAWSATDGSNASVFASAPAQAIIGQYAWEQPTDLTLMLTAAHAAFGAASLRGDGDRLILTSRMPTDVHPKRPNLDDAVSYDPTPGHAVTAVVVVQVVTDGDMVTDSGTDGGRASDCENGRLRVAGATELTVVVTTETDFVDPVTPPHADVDALVAAATARAQQVSDRSVEALREEHVAEHRSWFDRFDLDLGGGSPGPAGDDTDALLARAHVGDVDPRLVALSVAYGRYLMIASSRPGTRAMTLQGIWNDRLQPPWSSNYTVNINTEMNYWPALTANLAECAEPLYGLVETMAVTGVDTARRVFDRPGWAAHHNSDIWGYTLPVGAGNADPCWAAWPMAGFWLLRHFEEHYRFTGDEAFWGERAWPLIDGAVEFALASLTELPDGAIGLAPSTSPENSYLTDDGNRAAVTISATMDIALLRGAFIMWTSAAEVVLRRGGSVDGDRAHAVAVTLSRLPLPAPTTRGTYPEWRDDLTEAEPTHRHQSHLYDVFPGDAVSAYDPGQAPLLAAAAETLRRRGPYSTGWSLAWRIALHARLRDADAALASIGRYLSPVPAEGNPDQSRGFAQDGGIYRNLFCAHPPFQIDGNFGSTAGVIELLVQSHGRADEIGEPIGDLVGVPIVDLLPCLPSAWPNGRLTGARGRGGLTIDVEWSEGVTTSVAIRADRDQEFLVRLPDRPDQRVTLAAGETWTTT